MADFNMSGFFDTAFRQIQQVTPPCPTPHPTPQRKVGTYVRKIPSLNHINPSKTRQLKTNINCFIIIWGDPTWCTIHHCFKTIPDLSMKANPTVLHTHPNPPPPGKKLKGWKKTLQKKKRRFFWERYRNSLFVQGDYIFKSQVSQRTTTCHLGGEFLQINPLMPPCACVPSRHPRPVARVPIASCDPGPEPRSAAAQRKRKVSIKKMVKVHPNRKVVNS